MALQYRNIERDRIVWRDYTVDDEIVKSPVDIDALPPDVYRLIYLLCTLTVHPPLATTTNPMVLLPRF